MITAASLKEYTCKDLAQMAKQRGIPGWHAMRKDQLIQALVRKAKAAPKSKPVGRGGKLGTAKGRSAAAAAKRRGSTSTSASGGGRRRSSTDRAANKGATTRRRTTAPAATPTRASAPRSESNGKLQPKKVAEPPVKAPTDPKVARRIQAANQQREGRKDLATTQAAAAAINGKSLRQVPATTKDRVVLMVRDPFWLHAYWEISSHSISRAKAAMAEQWHTARPVLRLIEVKLGSTTSTAERVARDISIHGGVQNWYIDVASPPQGYRVEIGYLAGDERFHAMARSNTVQTPRPGSQEAFDTNWDDITEHCERIFALSGGYDPDNSTGELQEVFEERFQRPMGSPLSTRFGGGAELSLGRIREFKLEVDAEMIIYGRTEAEAHVALGGEPVKLRPDGTFSVRVHLPDRRQVLPVVASSGDGMEQRTVVLAVERNTKVMEPVLRDSAND